MLEHRGELLFCSHDPSVTVPLLSELNNDCIDRLDPIDYLGFWHVDEIDN